MKNLQLKIKDFLKKIATEMVIYLSIHLIFTAINLFVILLHQNEVVSEVQEKHPNAPISVILITIVLSCIVLGPITLALVVLNQIKQCLK
jgi:hypothetical protein